MKSVKTTSALIAACLSLGTTACQMPVEDEEAPWLEQDAEALVQGPAREDADCASRVRGDGHLVHDERGVTLSFSDSCHQGSYLTAYLSSTDESMLFDGAVLEGELVLPNGMGWYVTGSAQKLDDGTHRLELFALAGDSAVIMSMEGQIARSGGADDVRLAGTSYWY